MTEEEWLTCADPRPMLRVRVNQASHRKLRLLTVGFCRRVWGLIRDQRSRWAIEYGELVADQPIAPGGEEWGTVRADAFGARNALEIKHRLVAAKWAAEAATHAVGSDAWFGALDASDCVVRAAAVGRGRRGAGTPPYSGDEERRRHAELVREVLGNPFRLATLNPSWRTTIVVSLAHTMYEARDFSAMPILADALQDAGCDNSDMLDHLRGGGPHCRGCWPLDLILGKE